MGSSSPQVARPEVPTAVQPILGQLQSMVPQFSGVTLDPRIYTMTPLQQSAQNAGENFLSPGGPVSGASSTLSSILSPNFLNPATNPNLTSVLDLANQNFQRGLGQSLDLLGAQFGLSGQVPGQSGVFGTAARNVTRNALSDYGLNVGNILANQYNTGVQQQLSGLQSLSMIPNVLGSLSGLGALPQQLAAVGQQGQLDLSRMPFDMLLQILQATPLSYPSYGPSPLSQNLGTIANILQGGGSAAGGAAALMAL